MAKKQEQKNDFQSNNPLTFIKPSKVRLSKDGNYMLLFLGSAVISVHKNFCSAVFANTNKGKKKGA